MITVYLRDTALHGHVLDLWPRELGGRPVFRYGPEIAALLQIVPEPFPLRENPSLLRAIREFELVLLDATVGDLRFTCRARVIGMRREDGDHCAIVRLLGVGPIACLPVETLVSHG